MPKTRPKKVHSLSGQELLRMLEAATAYLESQAGAIDALNVFPVPDGDTGTNMLLTMRSSLEEGRRVQAATASDMARAVGRGALMGARGNSGVILSQILRGFAQALEGRDGCTAQDLAKGFSLAAELAYRALSKPVEGTLLTVIRDTAAAVREWPGDDVLALMEQATQASRESVDRTPSLLPVLKEAGVVDAGGQGLSVLLEGICRFLRGERRTPPAVAEGATLLKKSSPQPSVQQVYGYCTEFLIEPWKERAAALDPTELRATFNAMGDSVIVVHDDALVKVHLHTTDPGAALSYSKGFGLLHRIKIDNIDQQHQEYLQLRDQVRGAVAVVAVANGPGLERVFRSLGAAGIIHGGETMNPSVQEIQRVVDSVAQNHVIIMPNNPNVIGTARLVQSGSGKEVRVLPAESIPQGITALLALNSEADLESNFKAMEQRMRQVTTIELCNATRAVELEGVAVRAGQPMGIVNGELRAAGATNAEVLCCILEELQPCKGSIVTVYTGAAATQRETEALLAAVRQRFPSLEVELVEGGQPHYTYIVSVE
jgi:DAK2 domain fusion protein YloV